MPADANGPEAVAGAGDAAEGGPDIDIQIACSTALPVEDEVVSWVLAVLDSAPRRNRVETTPLAEAPAAGVGEVCIRFVDEAESAGLNGQYRGKNGPTNVLSFPADIDLPGTRVWGDIVVCAPLVHAEAAAQGKAVAAHFAHLLVHGTLHLLGYDHQSAAEADQMESLEKGILDRFGIADPYGEG